MANAPLKSKMAAADQILWGGCSPPANAPYTQRKSLIMKIGKSYICPAEHPPHSWLVARPCGTGAGRPRGSECTRAQRAIQAPTATSAVAIGSYLARSWGKVWSESTLSVISLRCPTMVLREMRECKREGRVIRGVVRRNKGFQQGGGQHARHQPPPKQGPLGCV